MRAPSSRTFSPDKKLFLPHVPALLTGAMPIPEHQDDHYTLGSPDEAVIYVLQNRENWTATRGALQWLAETVQTLPPPDEKRP